MNLIGLSGWARSGKDTVADIMVEEGYVKMSYADPLREFMERQNPILRMDGAPEYSPLSAVISNYGWQGYKSSPFSEGLRRLIQRTGTEAGRGVLGDNVWVDATIKEALNFEKVVITDCRFPNEVEAILERGGRVFRVFRPGVHAANHHPSETSLDDYPFKDMIINDGTLEDLKGRVSSILS